MVVGTARLILPELNGSSIPLPIRKLCAPRYLAAADARIGSHRVAEISRFAIAKQLRRQAEEHARVANGLAKADAPATRRVTPHISLGLMQAIVSMSRLSEIRYLYAVMEPALLRMLQCLGIEFEVLGPPVEYHGKRQPCYCELDQLLAKTWSVRREVWDVLTDSGHIWPLSNKARPPTKITVEA
jgi:N-acyl amino acid synthase of PEP-CTERM/exosortase system